MSNPTLPKFQDELEALIKLLPGLTQDREWIGRVDEVRKLVTKRETPVNRLVELMLTYNRSTREYWARLSAPEGTADVSVNGNLSEGHPILTQRLAWILHLTLVSLGQEATTTLRQVYAATSTEPADRFCVFRVMIDRCDPGLEQIEEEPVSLEIWSMARAWQLSIDPEIEKRSPDDLEQQVRKYILGLREQYKSACEART